MDQFGKVCYPVQTPLLTAGQAINREPNCWHRNNAVIGRASGLRRRCSPLPKNRLPQVSIQACFTLKGEGVWLVVANFLVSESFVFAAVMLCSATFYPYLNVKCYTFKGQSLEKRLPCLFRAAGNILNL